MVRNVRPMRLLLAIDNRRLGVGPAGGDQRGEAGDQDKLANHQQVLPSLAVSSGSWSAIDSRPASVKKA
jgi:hypothetical protein